MVHLTTVHHPFDPRVFHKQLASLHEAGFDTHLIAPHDQNESRNGIAIHPLPVPERRWQRVRLQSTVFDHARALDAEVYQIHDPELIPTAFLLKKTTGAQVVYDMHENYRSKGTILGAGLRALERLCFRWVDHVFLAEKSYRSIVEDAGVNHTYLANYFKPIGDDVPLSGEKSNSPSGPKRLLYTGTVANSRGLCTMLALASEIQRRERRETLEMVGVCYRTDQRAQAERRIRKNGLGQVINRIGWDEYVPPSAMPPHYRAADVGLALFEPHPNHVGSLLTKFYEYMHYGLPIICSDFPLWRSFVEENACGAVVPPGDVDAVLSVLDSWADRPGIYQRYVQNAQEAASKYRWEIMEERLVQTYQDLLL